MASTQIGRADAWVQLKALGHLMTSTPSGRAEARMQLKAPSHLMTSTRNGREEARAKVKAELTSNGTLAILRWAGKDLQMALQFFTTAADASDPNANCRDEQSISRRNDYASQVTRFYRPWASIQDSCLTA
jgi:hypothetical protein